MGHKKKNCAILCSELPLPKGHGPRWSLNTCPDVGGGRRSSQCNWRGQEETMKRNHMEHCGTSCHGFQKVAWIENSLHVCVSLLKPIFIDDLSSYNPCSKGIPIAMFSQWPSTWSETLGGSLAEGTALFCGKFQGWEVINLDNSLSGVDIIRDWIFFWPVELDKLCKCCQLALKVSASGSKSFCIYPTSKTWDSKTGPLSETAKGLGWEDRLWR